jgi:membrane protease YdiL (CAAX protease family)
MGGGEKHSSSIPGDKSQRWPAEPWLWGFIAVFAAAAIASYYYSSEWESIVFLPSGVVLAVFPVMLLTRKQSLPALEIARPAAESLGAAAWYACFVLASLLSRNSGLLGNDIIKWLWLVILPVLLLWIISRNHRGFKDTLLSIGLRRTGLGRALFSGLAAFIVLLPFILMSMPASQIEKLHDLFQDPLKAAIGFIFGLLLMLFTAGFTEEVFFRGVLQSRLARTFKSEMRGGLLTAFLFGLYHLPYAYFSADWATHGNAGRAVATVLTEQATAGVILGVLWARTRNLGASVLLHTLINVVAIMTSLNFNITFG